MTSIREMTSEPLPLVMELVADRALAEGKSPEEAFAVAHAALASLQALYIEGRVVKSIGYPLKNYVWLPITCDCVVVATAATLLANLCVVINLFPIYLIVVRTLLTQGVQAQRAERWLGASEFRASPIERLFVPYQGPSCLEKNYLIQHEDLIDLVTARAEGRPFEKMAFEACSGHLPKALVDRLSNALKQGDARCLIEIRDTILRPVNYRTQEVARLALKLLAELARDNQSPLPPNQRERHFGLLYRSSIIQKAMSARESLESKAA